MPEKQRPKPDDTTRQQPSRGEQLQDEVREQREKNKGAESGKAAPGDPSAGSTGPGANSSS